MLLVGYETGNSRNEVTMQREVMMTITTAAATTTTAAATSTPSTTAPTTTATTTALTHCYLLLIKLVNHVMK